MKLGELYDRSIEIGITRDTRGRHGVELRLAALRDRYEALSTAEKASFDTERLSNPYGDVRIVVGDRDTEFGAIVTGIQIEEPELLLAAHLRCRYPDIAVVAHHTSPFASRALVVEDTVWPLVDRLTAVGVSQARAESLVWDFIREREADARARMADASRIQLAEALELPVIAVHTPADLCHQAETVAALSASRTVGEAVQRMSRIPEMVVSAQLGYPVTLLAGDAEAPVGTVFLSQSVGWRPPLNVIEAALEAGAHTILATAAPEAYAALARAYTANLISLPHDMIDVLGMRVLYDLVFQGQGIHVVPTSNYRMVARSG